VTAADEDSIYIKDRKIGELEYNHLAVFFGEEKVDRGLWNAVLQEVAQSEDYGVRRMVLAVVLDDPAKHEELRRDDEIFYRVKKLIHRTKRRTGRATGIKAKLVGQALFVRHFVVSKEFIMFLLVICISIAIGVYFRYGGGTRQDPLYWLTGGPRWNFR
jgi:hypothetical protein